MKNIKKALILSLSVLLILVFANFSFAASSISAKNDTSTNESSNTSDNEVDNKATNNTSLNTVSNNTSTNNVSTNSSTNASKPISSSNSSGNLPNTGIEDTYLNFALILLLAIVLGMFSLVQYNKIAKKED